MIEIGLTGGIGSGKSTVADMLVARGAVLIDADRIVRDLQEPGAPVFEAMVQRWGSGIVADDGTLDRAAVATIVFADEDELKAINDIVHPAVGEAMQARRDELKDTDSIVVFDIPLLVKPKAGGGYYIDGHYSIKAASYGLQAGVQTYGFALMLMNDAAVEQVETSAGWDLGVGPSIVVVDAGMAKTLTAQTANDAIYAFTFGQEGLMAGLGLRGSKVTPID